MFLNLRLSEKCFNTCSHCYMKTKSDKKMNLKHLRSFIDKLNQQGYTKLKATLIGGEISALEKDYILEVLDILKNSYVRIVTALNYNPDYRLIYKDVFEQSNKWLFDNNLVATDMNQPIVYTSADEYIMNPIVKENLYFHRSLSDKITLNMVYLTEIQLLKLILKTAAPLEQNFNEIKINIIPNKHLFYNGKEQPLDEELYEDLCEQFGFEAEYSWHFDGRKCINKTAEEKEFLVINPDGYILPCAYYPYDINVLLERFNNPYINNINNFDNIKEIYDSFLFKDYYSHMKNTCKGKCPLQGIY